MTVNNHLAVLSETYLQISPNILESFPRFRPPVDLYRFDDVLHQVRLFHRAEERLAVQAQAAVAEDALAGRLFLLRDDYEIYAHHLSRKLGLVLVEDGLNAQEVAEIFFVAFRDRMEQFLDQPQKENLTSLVNDIAILAEYLWADPCRVAFLTKTLQKEYSLAVHSVNTMFIGLGIHVMASGGSLERESVVSLALGLLVHDLGMANVPIFIRDKKQYLVRRDRESIEKHLAAGLGKIKRLQIHESVVTDCMAQHHERLDGSGYPERRKGDALSMAGRLCGVADSFSAIIGDRPYHDARVVQTAAQTLAQDTSRYDKRLTALLLQLVGSESPICGETGESV